MIILTAYLQRFQAQLPASANIDVLEKPFQQAAFTERIRRRLEPPEELPPASAFTVADYLQLAELARRNVCLRIAGEHGARGKIIVQEGQTTRAEDQVGEGIEAFQRLAFLPRAEVSCHPVDMLRCGRSIDIDESLDPFFVASLDIEVPSDMSLRRFAWSRGLTVMRERQRSEMGARVVVGGKLGRPDLGVTSGASARA